MLSTISTNNMKNLIDKLVKDGIIRSDKVYKAMMQVDRGDFIDIRYAYQDRPQSINYQATISAPHMHAYALEYLKEYLKPGSKILDVGYGSGYLTVAFSKMINDSGTVVGIEHIHELCELGNINISKSHSQLLNDKKIILVEGDGRLGCNEFAPYDCIHVGAAAENVPECLLNQLAPRGRLMIPVGKQNYEQYIYLIDKDTQGNITEQKILSVRYVPLTSRKSQIGF